MPEVDISKLSAEERQQYAMAVARSDLARRQVLLEELMADAEALARLIVTLGFTGPGAASAQRVLNAIEEMRGLE